MAFGRAGVNAVVAMRRRTAPMQRISSQGGNALVAFQRGRCSTLGLSGASVSSGDAAADRAWRRRSRLEAILFLAREPLGLRKLAQLANLADGTEARTLLRSLQERYDERGCAFQVAQVA